MKIGLIVKPQGIRGELKVMPLTDDVNRFKKLKSVIIDDAKYRVISARCGLDAAFVVLENVNDRNAAETFRGKFMCVPREDAVVPEKDRFFIVDIIGCRVETEDGDLVGIIKDVTSAKTDVITVDCGDKGIMRFPFLKDVLVKVDVINGIMLVKEKRLKEIACYED